MDNKAQQSSGSSPPQKPWERAGPSSGPAPFKPPSGGSTSDVVEASGTAKLGEVVSTGNRNTIVNRNTVGRPVPTRPWQQQTYGSSYGGYGSGLNYNSGYGTGMYGSSGLYGSSSMYGGTSGGFGGSYGSGLYGNNMYGGGYNGLYGGGMNGGGMYNSSLGGPMGGYGMGMGGPYGEQQDPNNLYGAPSSPPDFWVSLMRVMHGVVNFFGRFSILIDQNTQAFHMFMTALLQLFDRSGLLYGELARFVLRILGIKTKSKNVQFPGMDGLPAPHNPHAPGHHNPHASQNYIGGPKAAPNSEWDGAWGNDASN